MDPEAIRPFPAVTVGVACDTPKDLVADMRMFLSTITERECARSRVPDLAGPNNTLQILLDPDFWFFTSVSIAGTASLLFGKSFIETLGKRAAEAVVEALKKAPAPSPEKVEATNSLLDTAQKTRERGTALIAGVELTRPRRNAGVQLQLADQAGIARQLVQFGVVAGDVQAFIESENAAHPNVFIFNDVNGDTSIAVRFDAEGSATITFTPPGQSQTSRPQQKKF